MQINPVVKEVGATYALLQLDFSPIYSMSHPLSDAGYCFSLSGTPTIHDSSVSVKEACYGEKLVTMAGLRPNRKYTVRLFAQEYGGKLLYSAPFEITTTEGNLNEQLAFYEGPKHLDDYTSIAGWGDRDKWNLANVHDPSVVKATDGYFYMYQTDASYGGAADADGHFPGRRSKDLVNWEYLGATMKTLPAWVPEKVNELRGRQGLKTLNLTERDFGYWAPVVRKVGETYRMYYSIVCLPPVNGEGTWAERAFIGYMENSDPANNAGWVDKGFVICSSTDFDKNNFGIANNWAGALYKFNAIDPSYVVAENGEHWLVYGSWHSGIAAVQIDPATGKTKNELGDPWDNNANYGVRIAARDLGRWQASEGPEIIYRNGYYYLFLAYDGLDVPYNTRVVRSKKITGPYVGIDGTDVTAGGNAYPIVTHPYAFSGDHGWVGISHCAVFDDGNDNWYYASQSRFPINWNGNEFSNALMMGHVRSIRWTEDGWPVVMPERYGAVPKVAITEDEIPGVWENLDLHYDYANQNISEPLVLSTDHTVTEGRWQGQSWSFDATTQTLTVGGVKLLLQRECDWESADRHATIVYAGYSARNTFWGKKNI